MDNHRKSMGHTFLVINVTCKMWPKEERVQNQQCRTFTIIHTSFYNKSLIIIIIIIILIIIIIMFLNNNNNN